MKKILIYPGLAILSIIAIMAINLVICSITAERISEGASIADIRYQWCGKCDQNKWQIRLCFLPLTIPVKN